MSSSDPRLYAPATLRNREPILGVLQRILPPQGRVLEVASGSGEHAVWFAQRLPRITWQPSDPDPACRASIRAHRHDSGTTNLADPLPLDTRSFDWRTVSVEAIVSINMVHIAPWTAAEGLVSGARTALTSGGLFYLYGPFRRDGRHTAPSNAAFDERLRSENPEWGVRDLAEVEALARPAGLVLEDVAEMPANNLSVWFRKPEAARD